MKTLFAVCLVLMASTVFASPYLVCDPQTGVTAYKLTGWTPNTVPAQPDGSIRLDVASAQVGTTSLTVAACKVDPVWGELCSVAVPFDLVRPGAPSAPSSLRLAP